MGLPDPPAITGEQERRSYITVIRRNWHLLPTAQLLELLGWTEEKLEFTLKEDDFLYHKLGSLKPDCPPVRYTPADEKWEQWMSRVITEEFSGRYPRAEQPLFHFVDELSAPLRKAPSREKAPASGFSPRFAYPYFALFGDPLLDPGIDPYPGGYLDRMAASGLDATWMHIVLSKLTPFPWDPAVSEHWQERLGNLQKLVQRAKNHGIGIYLYLNEPRSLPLSFFKKHPELKGVTRGGEAALCTSHPAVQEYLVNSMTTITSAIPDLAGFFSITASENPTNCWSHFNGQGCPRCGERGPTAVIAELNTLYLKGIRQGIGNQQQAKEEPAGNKSQPAIREPQLIAWDWGWPADWAEGIIPALPKELALMSVSEWELEIERGGIKSHVGEYSISAVGPGPRARRHWSIAKQQGLKTIAKIQAGNTWEIGAVPHIPAVANVARHAANLREQQVDGLMLSWTLGGHPSPNLEVVAEIGSNRTLTPEQAMQQVAARRYGEAASDVVTAWEQFSQAFSEFPYHIGVVYNAPLQAGPANLLWEKPTGYRASMVGIPYDDVKSWISVYPEEAFTGQLTKAAEGFDTALAALRAKTGMLRLTKSQRKLLDEECHAAETVAIHYHSIVNQVQFTGIRDRLPEMAAQEKQQALRKLEAILKEEIILARRMNELQGLDSRLGFEATNHYFYVSSDLTEKVINCRYLLDRWLPSIKTDHE
ncbi:hypothetical protein FRZ59_03160 [Anseongella ginsenosidimutans]|nr:hypothetical protein FRZ59_03160 [Anseongella ginsenosidimutans]